MAVIHRDPTLPEIDRPETREFWQGCRDKQLKLPHCLQCGRHHWYPLPACPYCQSGDLEWAAVSGRGTLFTWSEVRYPFVPELADYLPLLVALVAPEEAPEIHLVTNLVDCREGDLAIGMPVEVVYVERGPEVVLPMFRPPGGL